MPARRRQHSPRAVLKAVLRDSGEQAPIGLRDRFDASKGMYERALTEKGTDPKLAKEIAYVITMMDAISNTYTLREALMLEANGEPELVEWIGEKPDGKRLIELTRQWVKLKAEMAKADAYLREKERDQSAWQAERQQMGVDGQPDPYAQRINMGEKLGNIEAEIRQTNTRTRTELMLQYEKKHGITIAFPRAFNTWPPPSQDMMNELELWEKDQA